ncbi:MAG: putative ATP synthase F0, A subunit [Nitrosopumilales archaeon]|nr:MAG: putative ATP synthase F0, A subunit [Nitrosopumilales archaeon]
MSQKAGKLENETSSSSKSKLLVICVDRDNDVGEKTGISTPVVGRDACIEAAQRLALEDPEDADSNSIFSAIKTYEDLISKGYDAQVITVTGVKNRGVRADEKIASEIKSVLKIFSANGAVIVSDGEDDESVIPVIQNVLPVISVQRVVMKVSRTVEYSYAVFGKYLKMLAYDSKYSKFFLGVPGILLLIGGIATVFDYTAEIFAILVSILGGAFLIRAFDIDKAWSHWSKPTPSGFIRMFTAIAGIILILSSISAGVIAVDTSLIGSEAQLINIISNKVVMGQFFAGALPILWIGIGVIFGGMLLSNWLGGIHRRISDTLRLIVLAALYPTVSQFTNILINDESSFTLILPLLVGLAVTLVSAIILFKKFRKHKDEELLSD